MGAQGLDAGGLERVRLAESQVEKLEEMLRRADERAREVGRIVGRVSRFGEVKVGESSRVEFTIDPITYYGEQEAPFHRVGDYLVVVDPKDLRLVLVRVVEITRKDELAALGVQPPVSPMVDGVEPRGLITDTQVVGELVLELGPGDQSPRPAIKSVEPQAPVVIPSPDVLARLLDLPASGVPIGSLATPGGLVVGGRIVVRLPLKAFLHHVLIVGTTGAGKTTLLKNLLAAASSMEDDQEGFVPVVIDLNEDFVQLPLRPDRDPEPREVRENAFKGVGPPRGVAVVMPVTAQHLSSLWRQERGLQGALEEAVRQYVDEVVGLLLPEPPRRARTRVRVGEGATAMEVEGLPFALTIFPYAINTVESSNESLLSLMPGLTELARNTLASIRKKFMKRHGIYPPLEVVQAALLEVLKGRKLRGEGGEEPEELMMMAWDLIEGYVVNATHYLESRVPVKVKGAAEPSPADVWDKPLPDTDVSLYTAVGEVRELLEKLMPHKGTLEALYRRVSLLLDTGFVDVLYVDDRGFHVVPEPSWASIVEYAEAARLPVVVDLRWGVDRSTGGPEALRVIAYRMLERLMAWKQEAWGKRRRTPNVVMFIDEAHQFFPSEGKSREEAEEVSQVSALLSKVARLGRARGLGLVFSTHLPKDLNSLIIQLTNTKIVLRSEESQLESIALPQSVRQYLPRLQDRYMAVLSFVFRGGYVMAMTTTPLTKHFDISAG